MTAFIQNAYPSVDTTAPDLDQTILCPGCTRLTIQVSNQPIYITFGIGIGGAPMFQLPEPYLPSTGQIIRDFDAIRFRAYTPLAQLPPGAVPANVKLTPIK